MNRKKENETKGRRAGLVGGRAQRAAKAAIAAILLGVWLAGCSASDRAETSAPPETSMAAQQDSKASSAGDAESLAKASSSAQTPALANSQQTPAQAPNDPFSRKIIYTARLTMQVDSLQAEQAKIQQAVEANGGYVLTFSETSTSTEKSGMMSIKVPASGFQPLLTQLESLHPLTSKNIQGQDVTEEYVDLSSRLKAKEVAEARLLAFMEKSTKTDELVAFSNELNKVQEAIEQIKGRMRYLEQNAAYSTIELRIAQKIGSAEIISGTDRGPLYARAAAALGGTWALLTLAFQWVVVVLAGALPVLVLAGLLGAFYWFLLKRKRERLARIRRSLAEQQPAVSPVVSTDVSGDIAGDDQEGGKTGKDE